MLKLKTISLFLAVLCTGTFALAACEKNLPTSSYESSSSAENVENSTESYFPISDSSAMNSSTANSSDIPQENPAWEIVDLLYSLKIGESLEGTYTLSGTVTKTERVGKKDTITFVVEGREDYPIYCYGIIGENVSSVEKGDLVTVRGTLKNYQGIYEFDKNCELLSGGNGDSITPPSDENDPYANMSAETFYANYTPATNSQDAYYRSKHGFLSGELTVPDQAPNISSYRPKIDSCYVRNQNMLYDESRETYTVVDVYGNAAFQVYREGGYITLEEVAAYVYAFGTYPKNYTTSKNTDPMDSIWGEYLRLNHTAFSGSTKKYPYEPVLPNITGCGGTLNYFEMDIGTTGTDCDPAYPTKLYNDGQTITRGAARIVYGKNDLNGNKIYESGEFHLFYTYNHYNDFQEYLNYAGGWGEMFGNITGGGDISSTTNYNPTPYVDCIFDNLPSAASLMAAGVFENSYKTLLFGSI